MVALGGGSDDGLLEDRGFVVFSRKGGAAVKWSMADFGAQLVRV